MSEKNVMATFRKRVIQHPNRYTRIESRIEGGVPDVNVCVDGVESWIEVKAPRMPKHPTTPVLKSQHGLSMDQKNFLHSQAAAGGRAWVLIGGDEEWFLMDGGLGDEINEMNVLELRERCAWRAVAPLTDDAVERLRSILKEK